MTWIIAAVSLPLHLPLSSSLYCRFSFGRISTFHGMQPSGSHLFLLAMHSIASKMPAFFYPWIDCGKMRKNIWKYAHGVCYICFVYSTSINPSFFFVVALLLFEILFLLFLAQLDDRIFCLVRQNRKKRENMQYQIPNGY